jgi:hypothetical protein
MNPPAAASSIRCHECASGDLVRASGYETAVRVTSDCKPWRPGGVLARCSHCGLVQTLVDRAWEADCREIYDGYTIYFQGGGREQPVFDSSSGAARARSEAIVQALISRAGLPEKGRWLDIGCGNGALLRACSTHLHSWSFCGSEVNEKYRREVEGIPRVERLYTGPLETIPGTFDAISLVHVLEHIPGPSQFLRNLVSRLSPGGLLVLEVPDCLANSFMLTVADHCSHFSLGSLSSVAVRAGFEVQHASACWVPKELSLVARVAGPEPRMTAAGLADSGESDAVFAGWGRLQTIAATVLSHAGLPGFGIFGTAIAATWLDAQTGHPARFFVDEDPNRVGKQHMGRPILAPSDLPEDATVFVALPAVVGDRVAARLRSAKPAVKVLLP